MVEYAQSASIGYNGLTTIARSAERRWSGVPDREKVFQGLECCANRSSCSEKCPYDKLGDSLDDCVPQLARDAIILLKEQEPIKPTLSVDTWICSKCGHTLESQELIDDKENPQVLVHEQYEYCPCCGRKVKWE